MAQRGQRIITIVIVLTFAFSSVFWVPRLPAQAASPAVGTVSDSNSQVTWTGSTTASNPVFNPGTCQTAQNCDVFSLTINLSDAYRAAPANKGFVVFIRIEWTNATNDYDLYIRRNNTPVDESGQGFTTFEEVMLRQPANGTYQVFAHSFATVPGTQYSGRATLLPVQPTVAFRTGIYQRDPDGKFGPQMFQFTSDLRLIGANNGQTGQNVEPEIAINQFDTIYVSAIQGVPAGTDFWRSRTGGESFEYKGQPDGTQRAQAGARGLGGGDTDLSLGSPFVLLDLPGVGRVRSTGRVYVSSLWLGSTTVSTSIDEGDTFAVSELPVPVHDRQWNASAGTSRVWMTARQLGALLSGTTSLFVVQSDDGGVTYPRGSFITLLFTTEAKERLQGNLVAHPAPGRRGTPNSSLYNVYSGRSRDETFVARCAAPCNLPTFAVDSFGAIVPVAPKPFVVRRIFKAPPGMTVDNVFPVIAVDSEEGVHVAFSDKRRIFLMSSRDRGQTWTDPVQVNNPADTETATALFPWIFAGDSGRVGVMWYGTNVTGNADSQTEFGSAEWKIFYAFTANAFASSPTFQYVVASGMTSGTDQQRRGVVHIGSICTQGLACNTATPPGNRNLAEYSSLAGDPFGGANIVFAGDVFTPNGRARTHFIRQLRGPSALPPANDGDDRNDGGDEIDGAGEFEDERDADDEEEQFSFSVRAGRGGVWTGQLTYLDQRQDLLLTADRITSVRVTGNQATIIGTGTLHDGRTVTFTAVAIDNGFPGAGNDRFALTLGTGYTATGVLRSGNVVKH